VQELLQNKKAKAMLQSFTERESALRRFVALIRAELDVFVAPLRDVSGPAGTLRELELLVVSQETVAGARVVNEQRARNGLPPLAVVVVGLAAEFGASEKTSSTYIRQALARELEARVEALRQRWGGLCARLSDGAASAEAADAWWARLRDAYSEPIRAYHTLTHVEAMLAALDEVEAHMERPDAARLAAWLHDAVYDPRGSDNEERSADWLDACCGALGVHGEDARLARELVLATKTHSVPDSLAARADARYFLDADLLVLALRPSIYDRYSRQIRAEYAHLSEAEFRAGRGRVLRSLLDRAALFLTPYFRDRHEERARLNLRRELASLGA
jgi:predicted metal-dependent HD superfamily phosphohydrolase/phosphopantetheine adenylyltransferase